MYSQASGTALKDILGKLRCPKCCNNLSFEGVNLVCPHHGVVGREDAGIVVFHGVESKYFDEHWIEHNEPTIPPPKFKEAERFLAPILDNQNDGPELTVCLDVGTGNGVHLGLLAQQSPHLKTIGLDVSIAALQRAGQVAPTSKLILCDAHSIPLLDSSVDAAFAYGVLAYLLDPWQGLAEMVRVTRPGGLVGVWIFPRHTGVLGWSFRALRKSVPCLPRILQRAIANMIVPFLFCLPTSSGVSLRNAPWSACREVVLVNLAPPNLIMPTETEIVRRFDELGCEVLRSESTQPITVWARRKFPRDS